MHDPLQILKKYYSYSSFRPLQEKIIHAVLNGSDTLAILPTGGGKSLCFQIPTLCLNGVCLVISPLIALMNDQVENLQKKNITAISFSGNIEKDKQKIILNNIKNGVYSFIYISPEKLATIFFQNFIQDIKITLIAIDEAHCISQFGHLFRPSYRELNILKKILPNTPILALTASATKLVQQDIIQQLNLSNVSYFKSSFDRQNLSYSCFCVDYKMNKILDILNKIKGSSIIYCNTRNQTTEIANLLKLQNFSAVAFHAGLNDEVKKEIQKSWVNNKISTIVCTSAFGMGIDKPDVRTVIHYSPPDCIENYYQEAGRAGRDQLKSFAVLLYNKEDVKRLNGLASIKFPHFDLIKKVYVALCNFLKIPVGMGAKMSFYFDIELFCNTFELENKMTIQCLLYLEKEGHVYFSKNTFVKSTIRFLVNKKELENYESSNPTLKIIILCLLRTYSKILDSPV
ncbi:MAG: ATP-dependent DNA helicase, partial [Sediminibacterium sp.]|nr:ATP-dependent DNA helicase [Sediminibacterium sp.]